MTVTCESESPISRSVPSKRNRRIVIAGLVAVALVALVLVVINPGASDDESAGSLDGFAFTTADGGETSLAAFNGSPLVVNYFAAWCAPCRAELPTFEAVSKEVAADGVVFLGVSRDNDITTWQSFIAETGVTYQTVFEGIGGGTFEEIGAIGMPTTVFIAADGSVAEVFGGLLTEEMLRAKVEEHLVDG